MLINYGANSNSSFEYTSFALMQKHIQALKHLSIVGILEGISYLVLLFISMPFKYIFKLPQFVVANGWVHGFLFVLFAFAVLRVWIIRKWTFNRAFLAGISSLIPFGTFWFDKKIKQEIFELENDVK